MASIAQMKLSFFFIDYLYLLNSGSNILGKLMNADTLMIVIEVILFFMLLLIILIYAFLANKKKRHFQLISIQQNLDPLITQIIIDESGATDEQLKELKKLIQTPLARRYMMEELIKSKQNHSGFVSEKIVEIYLGLGLNKYSIEKIRPNKNWYVKSRGIQELYMMDQKKCYSEIYDYTNATNEYVRNEAQIGMIRLIGFKGLHFLEAVTQPITDWQQLKLLEQLKQFPEKSDISEDIPTWLSSTNHTVVIFALRLCYEYQYFQLSRDIEYCLKHESQAVRSKAVEVLIRLENNRTPKLLLQYFDSASTKNQLKILDAMSQLATEAESEKLIQLLDNPNNSVKLKAAIALVNCFSNGLQIIEEKARNTPEPFQRIYQHILTTS